jgi:MFS family permease
MQSVAQSWLVLQLSRDPLVLGITAAAQFAPVLFLGLFGGVIADVLPKRRTLIATQTAQLVLAMILFVDVAAGTVEVWHVIAVALALGCVNSVDMPVRQSFAIEMVGREDVGNAVALNSAMFNAARVIGPAVGGLTIGAFGVAPAFLINALSFLGVIVGLLLMRDSELHARLAPPRPESIGEVFEHLAEGLRYVRSTETVLLAVLVVGTVSTFGMNFTVLIPPFVQEVLHADASEYGFLMASTGVGSVIAALAIAAAGRTGLVIIGGGALVLGIADAALGLTSSFVVSLIAMFLAGVGGISMAASANTSIQLTVPDQLRGRVMSVYTTVFAGSTPIGGLITGGLASGVGPGFALLVGGIVSAGAGVLALVWRGRIRSVPRASKAIAIEGAETAEVTLRRFGR